MAQNACLCIICFQFPIKPEYLKYENLALKTSSHGASTMPKQSLRKDAYFFILHA